MMTVRWTAWISRKCCRIGVKTLRGGAVTSAGADPGGGEIPVIRDRPNPFLRLVDAPLKVRV